MVGTGAGKMADWSLGHFGTNPRSRMSELIVEVQIEPRFVQVPPAGR